MGKSKSSSSPDRVYLRKKDVRCNRCAVCGKALHSSNKSGLCPSDNIRERGYNMYHQKYKFQRTKKWVDC